MYVLLLCEGVVILEDWEFRSSSPYPASHRYLSLHSLLTLLPSGEISSILIGRFSTSVRSHWSRAPEC